MSSSATSDGWVEYPLTLIDTSFGCDMITLGWIVEGRADEEKLRLSIINIAKRWRLLAARIIKEDSNPLFRLRIPVSPTLPEDFPLAGFSVVHSPRPLSAYIKLPLGIQFSPLPVELMSAEKPSEPTDWYNEDIPLLHWRVSHFGTMAENSSGSYSWIGVTFPHVVFDGCGIATVLRILQAELSGKPWEAPFPIVEGPDKRNLLENAFLDAKREKEKTKDTTWQHAPVYRGFHRRFLIDILVGTCLWCWRQKYWYGAGQVVFRIPPVALRRILHDYHHQEGAVRLSKGDVLLAFVIKAIFSAQGLRNSAPVSVISAASLRRFFGPQISQYPFNAIFPLASPTVTVQELNRLSLFEVARVFARSREALVLDTALQVHEQQLAAVELVWRHQVWLPRGVEPVLVSNMIPFDVTNVDWTGCGVGRTVLRQKHWTTTIPLEMTNTIVMAGYLDDGSLLLDLHLTKAKRVALEKAIETLLQ